MRYQNKKHNISRICAVLCALCLLAAAMPAGVFAASALDVDIDFSVAGVGCTAALYDAADTLVASKTVAAGAADKFTAEGLSAGTYTYRLKVANADTESVSYDKTVYTVNIFVTGAGSSLDYTMTANGGTPAKALALVFNNTEREPDPETVSVYVSKLWAGLAEGEEAPASVTVHLLRDGVRADSAELTAVGGWRHTFSGLAPGYAYTVEEDEVEGFSSEISSSGHRFTITNTKNAGEPPRAVLDPPLQKTIEIKGEVAYDGSSSFTFVMEAKEADAPMPDGMRGGSKTRTVHDAGLYEFGEMEFGPEDVDREYTYYIREVHGSDERFTYDDRSYTMHVAVRVLDGKIVLSVSYIRSDNVRTSVMEFVNTFEAPEKPEDPGESGEEPHDPGTPGAPGDPEDESTEEEEEVDDPNNPQAGIPQTGQLWWPVPVLAVSGLLLCIAGMMLRRKSGNA